MYKIETTLLSSVQYIFLYVNFWVKFYPTHLTIYYIYQWTENELYE